jgi:hypothetical protein
MAAMRKRLTTVALAASLLLAAAPAAHAQSAGCSQYCDPVTGNPTGGNSSPGGSGGGGGSTSTPSGGGSSTPSGTTSSGTTSGTSTTTPTTTSSSTATEGTAAAPGELPRTGGDPVLIAIFGGALLLMGSGMRLALPRSS